MKEAPACHADDFSFVILDDCVNTASSVCQKDFRKDSEPDCDVKTDGELETLNAYSRKLNEICHGKARRESTSV